MNQSASSDRPATWPLIAVPSLITLAVTLLRLGMLCGSVASALMSGGGSRERSPSVAVGPAS